MTPAERLRAAADLLRTEADEGTSGPWTLHDPDPWGSEVEVRGPYDILVARTTRADGYLLLDLHAIARPVAAWLSVMADVAGREMDRSGLHILGWGSCGADIDATPARRCTCFDHPLALADAILGGAS